jgi:hypothetical protein
MNYLGNLNPIFKVPKDNNIAGKMTIEKKSTTEPMAIIILEAEK